MMGEYVPEFRADMLRVEPLILCKMQQGDNEGELDVADSQQVGGQAGKPKRGQANRRERVRTENVNAGFDKLRKLIPTEPENRKLSKIEILRLSTSYIKHLYNLSRANSCLEADEMDAKSALARRGSQIKSMNHVCTFCLMRTKLPNSRRSN